MKYNNRILSFVFIGLLVLVLLTKWIKSGTGQRSIKATLAEVDTSQIKTLLISPQVDKNQEVRIVKKNQRWFLRKEGQDIALENSRVNPVINQLSHMNIVRMAARNKDKWKDYEVEDATATQLKVLGSNDTELLNLWIGKAGFEGYDQFSYVRLNDEDEVYAIKSTFAESLNKKRQDWRDQTLIKFSPPDVKKLAFSYPGDSSFVVTKNELTWKINETAADSLQGVHIQTYLREISNFTLDSFEDKVNPGGDPLFRLTIEGNNFKPIQIQAFAGQQSGEFLLKSNLNTAAVFKETFAEDFKKIFKGKDYF